MLRQTASIMTGDSGGMRLPRLSRRKEAYR